MSKFKSIVESIINEMAYPSDFSIEEFMNLSSFKKRIDYCKSRLKLLGNGSSRIVFQIDDKKVLKIAKNKKGVAQNEHECQPFRNSYDCFAKMFDYDDNYMWIEMEIARKAKNDDFQKLLGVTLKDLRLILMQLSNEYSTKRNTFISNSNEERIAKYIRDEIYTEKNICLFELYTYMTDAQPDIYAINDWCDVRNWGVVKRNDKEKLVIIDDGFSESVFNDYYR